MFYSVLVLYPRTRSILKRKNVKELKQSSRDLMLVCNQCFALPHTTAQLTIRVTPIKSKCNILVEWKDHCLHFVLQYAYISLNFLSSPVALCSFSLYFRKHFKHYLKCCCKHEKKSHTGKGITITGQDRTQHTHCSRHAAASIV